ncbi:MAG: YggS family pyridoxal phosphate-dependent enzyme [Gammaproteobacteria bacterium]|nr:YggS family pyridoxal phosphate-dependent enzyme [Gammaproteobacteria bacterium]
MQFMNQTSNAIASRLIQLREKIFAAAHSAQRRADEIRLIAVSKTQSPEAVAALSSAGQKDFGESTTQEALNKIKKFPAQSITWHFIGHLQSNKAKFIPGNFAWLHSLDDLALASKLSRHAQEKSASVNMLIEVNVTRDPKKHGVALDALFNFVEQLLKADHPALDLRGLMTVGPHAAPEKEIRRCFAQLRQLRDACRQRFALPAFSELSMGMSGDYVEAVQEGATMLRIGTAIFGDRDYSK